MSQDIISDALNQLMNAVRANHSSVSIKRYSKLLNSILAVAKLKGYVKDYSIESGELKIHIGRLNGCSSIKPRFLVHSSDLDKYVKRYLPAKNLGILIVSTQQGLMTHQTAQEKNIGGSLIAYMF